MSDVLNVEVGIAKDICFFSLANDAETEDQKAAHVSIELEDGYLDFMWEGHFLRVPSERIRELLKGA